MSSTLPSPLFHSSWLLPITIASLSLALQGGSLAVPKGFADSDLIAVSKPGFPKVSYSLKEGKKELLVAFSVERFLNQNEPISVKAGVSRGERSIVLEEKDFKRTATGSGYDFVASIPLNKLEAKGKLEEIGFAFAVEWGDAKAPSFRDNYFHRKPRSRHAGLSADAGDWRGLDLETFARDAADRRSEIAINFQQPIDGKASIVIEDEQGNRIRNLTSALPLAKGRHRIVWDGSTEKGGFVLPGKYRWRAISHPGLKHKYLFSFAGAPGSNHGTIRAVANNGKNLYFATPVSEGGHEISELDADGNFLRGFNTPHGHGLSDVAVAADDNILYAVYDGMGWSEKVDKEKPDWKGTNRLSLAKVDLKEWKTLDFPDKSRHKVFASYEVGPGSPMKRSERETALAGMVLLGGKIYVANREKNEVVVLNPEDGSVERQFPLENPMALATNGSVLFGVADGKLLRIDHQSGAGSPIADVPKEVGGLTLGSEGQFFVADRTNETVLILSPEGKELRRLGNPGGVKPGEYDPYAFHRPRGMTVLNGKLWVTEQDRWAPKRYAAFDEKTGTVVREHIGPAAYGSPGAGFDEEDHEFWIALQTTFKVDFAEQKAKPLSITGGRDARRHRIWRQDGRTFVISSGKATFIQELKADGTMKPLAFLSSAHQYAYLERWAPPAVFIEALREAAPTFPVKEWISNGKPRMRPNHGLGVIWVDKNGDGEMQKEEFDFSVGMEGFGGAGWSHDFHDLTFRVVGLVKGKQGVLMTFKPDGYWPGGAPKYPSIASVLENAPKVEVASSSAESAVDRFGNLVLNSTPTMLAFDEKGKTLWNYPNQWANVHGSHGAPLPERGQLQGALFFTGVTPLDEQSDVFVMNGNHGQAFFMTSDGFYLDALFPDVRLLVNPQGSGIGILGGECFGGTFGRSKKNGKFYFQGGGLEYRIYEIQGLGETSRSEGILTVSKEQSLSAEGVIARRTAEQAEPLRARVANLVKAINPDGHLSEWAGIPVTEWRGGDFPVKVKSAIDENNLYLSYEVRDPSPWVNNGKDWQSLFKTGDGVDLQLGVDLAAKPTRPGAVPGDLRLFVAPFEGGSTAILYRHRVPGAGEKEGVVFQSPWRSEKVDIVKRLENVKIGVRKANDSYTLEAVIPLDDLGLKGLAGKTIRGDFGVIYGDAEGTINIFRNYWSNKSTGLVNDVPGEIMLTPAAWSEIVIDEKKQEGK